MRFHLFLHRWIFIVTLVLLAVSVQAQTTAEWTFMVYVAGDNDLESFIYPDIGEMQQVGSSDQVNVIVQIDRSPEFDTSNGDWSDTRRFSLSQKGNLAEANLQEIERVGEVDAGDPNALVDFVTWTIERFPAKKYALDIWSHGGGWKGIGPDESSVQGILTLDELNTALSRITNIANIDKLDLVGFDACLMGQLEVYQTLAPYTHYMIAAQEVIPGRGWAYDGALNALIQNPSYDGRGFGQAIVDTYIDYYTNVQQNFAKFDLHVIDSSKLLGVATALDWFAVAVQNDTDALVNALAISRRSSQAFGTSTQFAAAVYSSVDLTHFMDLLISQDVTDEVRASANAVKEAVAESVVYSRRSDALPNANGIAIYFPSNSATYNLFGHSILYPNDMPVLMQQWDTFLTTFHTAADVNTNADNLRVQINDVELVTDVGSMYDPPVVVYETEGQGVVNIEFMSTSIQDDGLQVVLNQYPLAVELYEPDIGFVIQDMSGFQEYEFYWDPEFTVLTDGISSLPVTVKQDSFQATLGTVSGIYQDSVGDRLEAYLEVDLLSREVKTVWGVVDAGNGTLIPFNLPPRPGDIFFPALDVIDAEGYVSQTWYVEGLVFSEEPFTFTWEPMSSGEYNMFLRVEDMAGNIAVDSIPVTVDNETIDPSYRAFKDIYEGITFLYPNDWAFFNVEPIGDDLYRYWVQAPSEDLWVYLEFIDTVSGLDDVYNQVVSYYDTEYALPLSEPQLIENADGSTAYYSTYSATDGRDIAGYIYTMYSPLTQRGYLIDVTTTLDAFESGFDVLREISNTIFFFEPRPYVPS